jgi:hypothetical protein
VSDLPPREPNRKPLVTITKPLERAERPPPCARCGGRSWWNGWRVVFPMVGGGGRGGGGALEASVAPWGSARGVGEVSPAIRRGSIGRRYRGLLHLACGLIAFQQAR